MLGLCRFVLVFLILCFLMGLSSADIYKWADTPFAFHWSGDEETTQVLQLQGFYEITLRCKRGLWDVFIYAQTNPYYTQASHERDIDWLSTTCDYHLQGSWYKIQDSVSFKADGSYKIVVKGSGFWKLYFVNKSQQYKPELIGFGIICLLAIVFFASRCI